MDGQAMYRWFEQEVQQQIPDWQTRFSLSFEPTVTPEVFLARISKLESGQKALIKTDVRPEGVRLHFPVTWGDELSEWLGAPPAEAYRLKSSWVNQPSIGVASADFEPYFKNLASKVIEILKTA